MSVRWAVVGLGGMGARMAGAVVEAAGAELVAVCSRDPERAEEVGRPLGARVVTDYEELLADPRVDAAYLATETHRHADQAVAAAEAGKHVLVEKPMALSIEDARAMRDAAERADVLLGIGFHLRLHPAHVEIRNLVGTEGIGKAVFAQALWGHYSAHWSRDSWKMDPTRAGSGSLAGMGVHLVDLLRFVLDDDVVEVMAVADGPNEERPVEFVTAATLVFGGGALAHLVSGRRLQATDDSLTVYCDDARLRGAGTVSTEPVGWLEIAREDRAEVRELPLRDLYTLEIESCSAAISHGTAFPASASDGVRSVEILAAVLESARSGRAVGCPVL